MFKNFITDVDRYIFKLVLMPMLGTLALAASLLILDKMLRLFEVVADEGGPIGVIFRMLANLLPEYMSLAIPLGLMLGILFAFRKLATSSARRRPGSSLEASMAASRVCQAVVVSPA